jgi:hypothetical protein
MVQNGADSARVLVPNMDGVMDEIKDLEAPENLQEINTGSSERAFKIIDAAIFAMIYSFIIFWVVILFRGGFDGMKEALDEEKYKFHELDESTEINEILYYPIDSKDSCEGSFISD